MTINEQQDQLIEEFSFFDEWMDRYEEIIRLGKELPAIDPQYKVPDNLIRGCQSQVWLHAEIRNGKIFFSADSDAIITKGLVALMIEVLSGRTPDEIISADLYFIEKIGLINHLSPTRSNGLLAMIKQMRNYAIAMKSLERTE